MLVLTRKKGESILIGNDIRVCILDLDGDKIRIGIEAPKDIKVMREELITQTIDFNIESSKFQKDIFKKLSEFNKNG